MVVIKRQIIKIDDSLGLTLPSDVLKALNINNGDEVDVVMTENHLTIKKLPKTRQLKKDYPIDFSDNLKEEMEAHEAALKGLVDR
ncbi:AbrB/MazE/SpoVT family DNA-binding domain-containing protein [Planococcus salinarum]|uniref:AbrB/MazE/SpoVT family DNA-binding domain-containing protein n=1 Tax=Planococcus salinarum TaxID=622695 RepID=UPI000E3B9DC2|nr:AbrB/MazE/SpoVT family DNA-binding domain-containing protein [Planococcus salinarum]TAA72841.1 AbrB/MazE/SpoVT family DNA-binding domain-containing protein [Planococcus salinarum]